MAIVWDQKSISIVVVPDSELLSSLVPIMKEWTEEGLLGRFLFVGPDSVTETEDDSIEIKAQTWSFIDGGYVQRSMDLFEQIAQYEFEVVRVVSVRSLDKDSKLTPKQNKLISIIAESVSNALPMANARLNETQQVTRLLKLNLIVSPSKIPDVAYELAFVKNWDMHVIASPEDRSTPWTADALVRVDQRYLRFVMMHIASTAGMWNGLGVSPFELIDRESAKDGGKWLSRVFVNAILTDGLSRRVAAKVLDEIASATKDIYDSSLAVQVRGTRPIPPEETEQWIDWMVGQTFALEDSFLTFSMPATQDAPGKLKWLEWDQIKSFLLFSWDKLKVIPWWMYVWLRRLVGRKLQQAFQTDEGLAEIGISQNDPMDMRDLRLAMKLTTIKEHAQTARNAMSTTEAIRSAKGTPRLWSGIRKLLFGMLDGSDLSEFGIKESDGLVPVFSSTSQVITDPADIFSIPKEYSQELRINEITWANIDQVEPLLKSESDRIQALRNKQNEILAELAKLSSEIDSTESKVRGF